MILLDSNVLLYAYSSSSPDHPAASRWLTAALNGAEAIGLPWLTVLAFLRVSTNRRIYREPHSTAEALAIISDLLALPNVIAVVPGERHWGIFQQLVKEGGVTGDLIMDTHLAALTIEHGATLCSTDRDFTRFPGLRLVNPLQAG